MRKKKTLKKDEAKTENSPSGYAPSLNDFFKNARRKKIMFSFFFFFLGIVRTEFERRAELSSKKSLKRWSSALIREENSPSSHQVPNPEI